MNSVRKLEIAIHQVNFQVHLLLLRCYSFLFTYLFVPLLPGIKARLLDMQEQNSSKLYSKSLLQRVCKQNNVNTHQHPSVSQVAVALGVITRREGIFLGFYPLCVDASDFLKII